MQDVADCLLKKEYSTRHKFDVVYQYEQLYRVKESDRLSKSTVVDHYIGQDNWKYPVDSDI